MVDYTSWLGFLSPPEVTISTQNGPVSYQRVSLMSSNIEEYMREVWGILYSCNTKKPNFWAVLCSIVGFPVR